jgi:hypothetical protein
VTYSAPVGGQFAVYTSIENIDGASTCENGVGNGVNCNQYNAKTSVYLNGGPSSSFLPDSWYCFSVYNSSGNTLLSTDLSSQRTFQVVGGEILYSGSHDVGSDNRTADTEVTIQFAPFLDSDNGIYKYALYQYPTQPTGTATECAANPAVTKTDNFSVAAAAPSVGVTKVDSGDGSYGPNEAFYWTLSWTVTNPPTTSALQFTDALSSSLNFGSLSNEVDPDNELSCSQAAGTVSCTLDAGAGEGAGPTVYSIRVNVTVKAAPTCGTLTNTVNNAAGAPVATDTVTIVDCDVTPAPQPSVSVTKDAALSSYNIGQSFDWVITANVSNGPTVSAYLINDDIPSAFTVNSVTENDAFLTCNNADPVACTLAAGATNGAHTVTVNVTVNANAACQAYTNNVVNGTAPVVASDIVTVTGCGSVSILKGDGVGNGANVEWTITLTNTSAVPQNVYVYDQDTSLVSETCTGSVTESPADYYNCTVPANSSATLVLSTVLPAYDVCAGIEISNHAVLASANTSGAPPAPGAVLGHDGGGFNIAAVADASCITVSKVHTGGGVWTISFTNTGPQATVDMSDTYEPNGTATDINSTTAVGCTQAALTLQGCDVSVPANGQTSVTVTTDALVSQCAAQRVTNTVTASFNGTALEGSPDSDTYSDAGTPALCNRTITITKTYVGLNGYVPGAADLPAFVLTPDPFDDVGTYLVVDDANCDLTEGNPDVWTCSVPAAWDGTVNETAPANWEQVNCALGLVRGVAELVQSILPQQVLQSDWFFCNQPLGSIEVIKIDNVAAGNPGAPADNDWDFTVTGPNAFSESDDIARLLNNGSFTLSGVPLANGYNAVEDDARVGQCPTDSNPTGEGYETFVVAGGPQNLTAPGQKLTFIFRNEDCGAVLGTGQLQVFKVRDINGNGVKDGPDTNIAWTVTVTGPQFPGGQQFNVPATGLFLDGIDEGVYTIQETLGVNYVVVGVETNDNAALFTGGASSTSVNLTNNDIDTVTFFNQPFGEIRVQKVAYTKHNNNADVLAPNDDDGWVITVSSVQCQFSDSKPTDASGVAVFTNLELCNDYVVSENPVNAASPGFQPGGPTQLTNQTPGPAGNPLVVTFVNRLQTFDPPCAICNPGTTPTPTQTPATPTATPTTPSSTATPTNTPVAPTGTPTLTPTAGIAGERTPGPGAPGQTPIAPSTGDGLMGGASGGMNLLLIIGGLLALTSGLSFVALGRKRS